MENREDKKNIRSIAELLFKKYDKTSQKEIKTKDSIPDEEHKKEIEQKIKELIPEPKREDMHWYVIHTYSGYEQRVKDMLMERVRSLGKEDEFGAILIPSEKVVEIVKGKKRTTERRLFPGYVFVQMVMNEKNWYIVRNTARVSGFVGKARKPIALSQQEIVNLARNILEGNIRPRPKVHFVKGDVVKIKTGPFSNFQGVIDEVNVEKSKVKVLVSIFGRTTPVELDFTGVEKV